jgi:hypothetical protein
MEAILEAGLEALGEETDSQRCGERQLASDEKGLRWAGESAGTSPPQQRREGNMRCFLPRKRIVVRYRRIVNG